MHFELVTAEEKVDFLEELICSQGIAPHCHLTPGEIAEETKISCLSIRRMIKRKAIAF